MIFHDAEVSALNVSTPTGIQALVEVHLCGHPHVAALSPSDERLVKEFVERALPAGITFQQFNELLLVLNQNRVSPAFFQFFFGPADRPLTMALIQQGVIRFKGYAMVCFGNFRFAFRKLSTMHDASDLKQHLGPCCRATEEVQGSYSNRAEKVLDTSLVSRDETWFVGEITGNLVASEVKKLEAHRLAHPEVRENQETIEFAKKLVAMDKAFKAVQEVALRNTDVYLTWDHLDIYVATSMRNKWEFEEVFDFTRALWKSDPVVPEASLF